MPSARTAAPARARRGPDHRRVLGRAARASTPPRTLPHIGERLESEGWLPNFDLRRRPAPCPPGGAGASSPTRRSTSTSRPLAWEIGRSGDAALEARVPRRRRPGRRGPGGRRLPQHRRSAATGQGARWSRPGVGARAVLPRPPVPGGRRAGAHPPRRRRRPARDRPARRRPRVRGLRRRRHRRASAATPRSRSASPSWPASPATPRYARQARAVRRAPRHAARSRDIEWGRSLLPGRRAGARRRGAARPRRARELPRRRRGRRRGRERRRRPAGRAARGSGTRTVARRTYITGGQGSHHQDEAFGEDWELPSDRAYSETCAGIGSIMFAWRLLLADGDAAYADLIERTLYNVVATSPAADGRVVLLRQHAAPARARHPRRPATARRRARRRRCARRGSRCRAARPNVARTLASLDAVRRDGGRRRASSSTSTHRPRSARRSPTGSRSR